MRIEMERDTPQKPKCEACGYAEGDARIHGDHYLCKNAGNAPWESVATPEPAQPSTVQPWMEDAVYEALAPIAETFGFQLTEKRVNRAAQTIAARAPALLSAFNVDEIAKELTMNLINRIPDVHAIYLDAILFQVKLVLQKYAPAPPKGGL